jgi:hypothetical protein
VNVALPADARRVSQSLGDSLDGPYHIFPGLSLRVERLELLKCHGGQHSTSPGAEVLGSKLLPGDLAQIIVDVCRTNVPNHTVAIDVLKQFLTRQFLTPSHDTSQATVLKINLVSNAALTLEHKLNRHTDNCDMSVSHRRQTK